MRRTRNRGIKGFGSIAILLEGRRIVAQKQVLRPRATAFYHGVTETQRKAGIFVEKLSLSIQTH
jgi:hypothetical protein